MSGLREEFTNTYIFFIFKNNIIPPKASV